MRAAAIASGLLLASLAAPHVVAQLPQATIERFAYGAHPAVRQTPDGPAPNGHFEVDFALRSAPTQRVFGQLSALDARTGLPVVDQLVDFGVVPQGVYDSVSFEREMAASPEYCVQLLDAQGQPFEGAHACATEPTIADCVALLVAQCELDVLTLP